MPATKSTTDRAEAYNQEGLQAYADWDIERAVERFQAAIRLAPERAEYHLNLARAFSRAGDFDQALRALAEFLRLEPDSPSLNGLNASSHGAWMRWRPS